MTMVENDLTQEKVHELKWGLIPFEEGEEEGWKSYTKVHSWTTECGCYEVYRLVSTYDGEEEVKWSACVGDEDGKEVWVEGSNLGEGHPKYYKGIANAIAACERHYCNEEDIKTSQLVSNRNEVISKAVDMGLSPMGEKIEPPPKLRVVSPPKKPKEKKEKKEPSQRKPKEPKLPKEPKEKKERVSKAAKDEFGSRLGTQGALMNAALKEEFEKEGIAKAETVATKLDLPVARIRAHQLWLQNKGFGTKTKEGFSFTK